MKNITFLAIAVIFVMAGMFGLAGAEQIKAKSYEEGFKTAQEKDIPLMLKVGAWNLPANSDPHGLVSKWRNVLSTLTPQKCVVVEIDNQNEESCNKTNLDILGMDCLVFVSPSGKIIFISQSRMYYDSDDDAETRKAAEEEKKCISSLVKEINYIEGKIQGLRKEKNTKTAQAVLKELSGYKPKFAGTEYNKEAAEKSFAAYWTERLDDAKSITEGGAVQPVQVGKKRWMGSTMGNTMEDGSQALRREGAKICIIDCKSGKEVLLIAKDISRRPRPDAVSDELYVNPCMSSDGKNLAYMNQFRSKNPQEYEIAVINLELMKSKTLYSGTDFPGSPTFSPDGGFVGFAVNSFVYICDNSGGNLKKTKLTDVVAGPIAVFPGGKQAVYSPLDEQNRLILLDIETAKTTVFDTIAIPSTLSSPVLSPDGQWIYYERRFGIESDDMEIRVYSMANKEMKVLKLNKAGSDVYSYKGFSGDSKYLICDAGGKLVRIDLATGKAE
ncbi:MAG: PD40 domain-containing protein [Planctomycetes bacterium]|nr:PD40 domain-containing protein [Planctomycetota bacterium]